MNRQNLALLYLLSHTLYANEQLIVVLSQDFDTNKALLQRYEKKNKIYQKYDDSIEVNLGKKGLGWGKSPFFVLKNENEPIKKEGDLKSPAGVFELTYSFGYNPAYATKMPYLYSKSSSICVDDSNSKYYNRVIDINSSVVINSFEWMRREDNLYKVGIFVNHNQEQIKGAGSCIFFHIQRDTNSPTSGCTSMKEESLNDIIRWLNPQKKPLLLQIPRSKCLEFEQIFNGIDCL